MKEKQKGLQQVLLAGGATITHTSPPFNNLKSLKFGFIDKTLFSQHPDEVAPLIKSGIPCLMPEFLSSYLLEYYAIPENLSKYKLN